MSLRALLLEPDSFYAALLEKQCKNQGIAYVETRDYWYTSDPIAQGFDVMLISDDMLINAGFSQLYQLKLRHPKTLLIVLHSQSDPHFETKCYKLGAYAVIAKNRFVLGQVTAAFARWFQKRMKYPSQTSTWHGSSQY